MRTNVYIDSFNLYFGCLRGSPYKWINLAALCQYCLPSHYDINRIRFFTALVHPRPGDTQQVDRQRTFIRALETIPNLSVHYGQFLHSKKWKPRADSLTIPPKMVQVLHTEEKGSDVNLATCLLVDAFDGDFDAAVVITDDSDLVEPIRIVRKKFRRHVTVLSPRGRSRELSLAATRFYKIEEAALRASQFPPTLQDANGTITKPRGW